MQVKVVKLELVLVLCTIYNYKRIKNMDNFMALFYMYSTLYFWQKYVIKCMLPLVFMVISKGRRECRMLLECSNNVTSALLHFVPATNLNVSYMLDAGQEQRLVQESSFKSFLMLKMTCLSFKKFADLWNEF